PLPLFISRSTPHSHLHSFPTRRSSDLHANAVQIARVGTGERIEAQAADGGAEGHRTALPNKSAMTAAGVSKRAKSASAGANSAGDRKSTRLNSSHVASSYAVFCLKKKT